MEKLVLKRIKLVEDAINATAFYELTYKSSAFSESMGDSTYKNTCLPDLSKVLQSGTLEELENYYSNLNWR